LHEEPAGRHAARAEGAEWLEDAPLGGAAESHLRRMSREAK
jgi:hypothetical protein